MAFDFESDFTAEAVAATFSRSFEHDDWIDGVSTIQAESNGAEKGFNVRFREIERDLDALGHDGEVSLAALTRTRQELNALLDEIRDELQNLGRPLAGVFQAVPLAAGWSPLATTDGNPTNPLSFLIDRSRIVHLRGALSSTTPPSDAGLPVCTLPTGARPENKCLFGAFSGGGVTRVEVLKSGTLLAKGAFNGFLSLDGLHFLAA